MSNYSLFIFSTTHKSTLRGLVFSIRKIKINTDHWMWFCRFLYTSILMILLMSVDSIWYIGHLIILYQIRIILPCCVKDLWGQKSGWGTLKSSILSTHCNNKIIIRIVINSFNTTLATFCHWIYSVQNISEVSIFFRKRRPTLRLLKVNIEEINYQGS